MLGHFLTHNVLFQVEEALKHLFAGSNNFEYMFFCVRHLQNRVGRACTGHPSQKNNFFCPKLAFLGHFWAKNGHFLGGAALNHPFSRFLTRQHMFSFVGHLQNRVGGVEWTTRAQKTLLLAQKWHS